MKVRATFGFLASAALLLVGSSEPSYCKRQDAEQSVKVTVSELAIHPQKYDGKLVCFKAVAVNGLEGDNFLIDPWKPIPLDIPSTGDPASVWFYTKQLYAMLTNQPAMVDQAKEGTSDCHDYEGYFHFVAKPRMMGVFYPGSLQLELVKVSSDQSPHSLAAAMLSGNIDETRRILKSEHRLRNRYKSLFLFLAVNTGRVDFAQELLAAGADPRFTRAGGDTTLMAAAWRDDTRTARLLLDHGAAVNSTNIKGETALIAAIHSCWDGKTGLTPEAGEAGDNTPDIQDRRDRFEKCRDGKMVQLLLDAGADPNIKAKRGYTALLGAAMEGNAAATEALLKAGADPSSKTDDGSTPETESCDRGEAGKSRVCTLVREALKSR